MPRQARIDAPGAMHHITCRGMRDALLYGQYRSKSVCRTVGRCFTKGWPLEKIIERAATILNVEKQ